MKRIILTLVLCLLPLAHVYAQTCQTASITASTPTSRFTDNGDGTLVDSVTELMWKKCTEGQSYNATTFGCDGSAVNYTWQGALQQTSAVNNGGGFAGHVDWRLPNIKELNSIVERQCVDPVINLDIFPATPSSFFWSASPSAGDTGAWFVDFYNGFDSIDIKSNEYGVRLVRGGQ
ncbi:DUF1566 domain-containing protein [Geothermobacter hydrogeniphilus]|uniref:Lcl C-terminal domain-containing protein n=1 Tax=Geothermobacter hydrogeniphilus TaxID=1969733 RepID=UPI001553C014|nr:DUF1566 domain-containing protein [Geothermobacter hydrogeniphilus]